MTDNSELPDGDAGYREVGRKKPNPFGLYDIYGNVAELVVDQYDAAWYATFQGRPDVGWRDAARWPAAQYPRVARGGGYESEPEECRSAARQRVTVAINAADPESPKSRFWWTDGLGAGFRVVSPVREPAAGERHRFWDADNPADRGGPLTRDREVLQLIDELRPSPAHGR